MFYEDLNNKDIFNEEQYKYIDNIEVLVFKKDDNTKIFRDFLKDYNALRCLIKNDTFYFWDAESMTHADMSNHLNIYSEFDNDFAVDKFGIDSYPFYELLEYCNDSIKDYGYLDEDLQSTIRNFIKNYNLIKQVFSIDLDEAGFKALKELKKILLQKNNESLLNGDNLNDNFWKWFGDSITVDDNGEPIVFYHGTRSDFVEFKSEYDDNLIFFAFDKKFADEWGRNKSYSNDIKDTIYNRAKPYRNNLYKSYQSKYGDDFYFNNEEMYKLYKDEINNYENELEKEYNVHSRTIPCYLKIHKIFMPEKHYELVLDEIMDYYGFPKEALDHKKEIEELRKEKEILISNFKSSGRKLPTKEEEDELNTINDKISILYDEQNSLRDFETNHLKRIKKGAWIYFEHGIVIDKIWSLGFDAIQLSESNGQQTTMAVRANNNQIKAINNNGNWSNSNNIYEDIHHFNINDINFDDIDLDWDDLGIDDKEDENKLEIEYDPTEHWVVVDKNSINDNFAKWWGNSQCCNSKGEPIIVYHSTNAEFDTFKTNLDGTANGRPVYGGGFCFSAYENYTKEFGKNTMPCVLSIQKPLDLSKNPKLDLMTTYKLMYKDSWRKYYYDIDHVSRGYLQDKSENVTSCFQLLNNEGYSFEEIMNAYGYDGIIDGHVFVVVRPNQIKSINNKGTWSKNSDNIYETLNKRTREVFMILYHGTNKKFDEFKPSIKGSFGRGIYLSPNYATAKMYGKYLYKVKTNLKNPLYINSNTDETLLKHVRNNEIEELQKLGYDGLIIGNENHISEVVVWNNTQLEIVNESFKKEHKMSTKQLIEKLKQVIINPKEEDFWDEMEDETGMNKVSENVVSMFDYKYKQEDLMEKFIRKYLKNDDYYTLYKVAKMLSSMNKLYLEKNLDIKLSDKEYNELKDDLKDLVRLGDESLNEEVSSAQLGTAPTPSLGQVTVNGKPWTSGKSYKAKRKKKQVKESILFKLKNIIKMAESLNEQEVYGTISEQVAEWLDKLNFKNVDTKEGIVYKKEGNYKHLVKYNNQDDIIEYRIIKDGNIVYNNKWTIASPEQVSIIFKEINKEYEGHE